MAGIVLAKPCEGCFRIDDLRSDLARVTGRPTFFACALDGP